MSNLLLSPDAQLKNRILSLLRIVTAFAFGLHGLQLIFGLFGGSNGHGTPVPPLSFIWWAGILELIGGALVLLGLFTRPVAFVLSGEMAVAFFWAHFPRGVLPITNGGELSFLYSFVFLYLSVAGGGSWSLDRLLVRRGVQDISRLAEGALPG